ncbi:peptidase M18 aminopeptidase I [Dacryopinax primogenitus]|uniref:Peptidase M18 aminopeptidase I n=1 Tax=Dacryopinax primogenitus (strain DJM 731) TaxID=1858805 RepID=M5GBF1_DACPD|nr:peptidase M18 aminopeptidase I [Dacryopinax primogenitus]EJU03382.1 peptidase M18 aminopeptidase I [Dacryopinax primogenitus]
MGGGQPKNDFREDDVLSLDEDAVPPYAEEFCAFIDECVTTYHACEFFQRELTQVGYIELKEKENWIPKLKAGGKYFVTRNTSSIIAFAIGEQYSPGNGFAMIASHIDALCMKVKPVSRANKDGFDRIAVAPYAGGGAGQSFDGSFSTWWDRDLGLGGRVLIKGADGKVVQRLVCLSKPVARIPSLAAHFGDPAKGPFNYETNMVPLVGMTSPDAEEVVPTTMGKQHSSRLLKAVAKELGVSVVDIVDFDLELFDKTPSCLLGFDSEFISAPRIDDKLCSFAAITGLINATSDSAFMGQSGIVNVVGCFDMEEVGSALRHGARSNFMQTVMERIVEAQVGAKGEDITPYTANLYGTTAANSFMISADVTHAFNPDFDGIYLNGAAPMLNMGVVIACDPNGHMTTVAPAIAFARTVAELSGVETQLFQIRNDSRSGGTVGPMLSERLGVPAIDLSLCQMSMHSIRAMTGAKDPGFGVKYLEGFFRHYQTVSGLVQQDY